MSKLVNKLIKDGYLKNDLVIDAMEHIDRTEFVPSELELLVNADVALPVGHGQMIPRPLVMALMLELLDLQKGNLVLDVGCVSGWTTSLLSRIVGENGKVISLGRIKALSDFAKKNVDKYDFCKKGIAEFYCGEINDGLVSKAPYDRILVAPLLFDKIPQALKDQLKIGGKMVIPIGNTIIYIEKDSEDDFSQEEFPGFDFLPFVLV